MGSWQWVFHIINCDASFEKIELKAVGEGAEFLVVSGDI